MSGQFHFVSDQARSTLLAVLGQMPSTPLMLFATRLTLLLDTDNTWAQAESLLATILLPGAAGPALCRRVLVGPAVPAH